MCKLVGYISRTCAHPPLRSHWQRSLHSGGPRWLHSRSARCRYNGCRARHQPTAVAGPPSLGRRWHGCGSHCRIRYLYTRSRVDPHRNRHARTRAHTHTHTHARTRTYTHPHLLALHTHSATHTHTHVHPNPKTHTCGRRACAHTHTLSPYVSKGGVR